MFALRQTQTWKRTIWMIIIVVTGLSLLGLYQSITGNYTQNFMGLSVAKIDLLTSGSSSTTPRHGGPIHDPNMWGQVVAAVLPLVIFRVIDENRIIVKALSAAILGLLLFELFSTYSRGAYLALAITTILIIFVFEKRINRIASVGLIVLMVLAIPFLPSAYQDRFGSLLSLSSNQGIYVDSSFRGRASEVLAGLQMFADNPVLGIGAGNFRNNYQRYAQKIGIEVRSEERDAHSLYVQILAEEGVLGAIPFFGILIILMDRLNKARRHIQDSQKFRDWLPWVNSIQVAIIGYLIAATFLHGAYIRYFWILTALAIVAIQLTDEMLEEPDLSHSLEASAS